MCSLKHVVEVYNLRVIDLIITNLLNACIIG